MKYDRAAEAHESGWLGPSSESSCAHVDTTEDLALGILDGEAAAAARAHLAACEACRAEHALFVAERKLFVARAAYHLEVAPPPAIHAARSRADRVREAAHHHMKGFVAALACAAAVFCVAKLDASLERYAPRPSAENAQPASARADEPLSCAAPASGFVFTPADQLCCRATFSRACEDEPVASFAR